MYRGYDLNRGQSHQIDLNDFAKMQLIFYKDITFSPNYWETWLYFLFFNDLFRFIHYGRGCIENLNFDTAPAVRQNGV